MAGLQDWLQRKKENGEIELNNDAISEVVKPQLDAMKTEFESSMESKLKPIADYFASQQAKEAETARQAAARQRKTDLEIDPTDYITDPEGVLNKRLQPLVDKINAQSSIIVRNEILGKMDYYSSDPTFKAKVDSLIDAQGPESKANAAVVMNAYKTVVYDHMQDIQDGKIKSQASLAANAGGGKGGYSGSASERREESDEAMSAEEKVYARKLGISDKDWTSTRKELEYV